MSSFRKAGLGAVAVAALLTAGAAGATGPAAGRQTPSYAGIGRPATPQEVQAWDIDVRPDFKGLPPGSGSVAQGGDLWEAKCSTCHGSFGEANQVFTPLVGGTTADDVKTGHVARLLDPAYPGRTTIMKVATVSTLWDYIRRAMPWTAPKSLSPDQVYALLAYMLNLANVVPDNFTLSNTNIAQVQQRMPNRNGMTTDHGLWPGRGMGNGGRPDVHAVACMTNCAALPVVASFLPDFARNAHGNLAQQNRLVGAQLGADTSRPPPATLQAAQALEAAVDEQMTQAAAAGPAASSASAAGPASPAAAAALALLSQHHCTACHAVDSKRVGPALREVARKYASRPDAVAYLAGKIHSGGSGLWGPIPMPPQSLSDADAQTIARWLAAGAPP
ncbi:MAG: c-type cytochrome [Burkholderiales bacterium]|nr:c-type cytochrome [Burkholderiales bacterium]